MEKYFCFIFIILLSGLPRKTVSKFPIAVSLGNGNRIIGGRDVTIEEFPYQAMLLIIYKELVRFQCGASIISEQYVLTAAHCIPGASIVTVVIGTAESDVGGTEYDSRDFKPHPSYSSKSADYDVAYVRTVKPMAIDGIHSRVVKLAPSDTPVEPGTIFTVSGWGADVENGTVTNNLKAVQVPVISENDCRRVYQDVTPRMICAGVPEGGMDSCQGDSGGPAVTDDGIQRGIVSFGYGCARKGYPGVYTNVSAVRSWILENTGV